MELLGLLEAGSLAAEALLFARWSKLRALSEEERERSRWA